MELMENPLYEDETSHKIDFVGSQAQKFSSTVACKQTEDSTYIIAKIPTSDCEDSKRNDSFSPSRRSGNIDFEHDYDSLESLSSDYEPPRNWTSRYVEIPEPDYDDTVRAPIASKSPFSSNLSNNTINISATLNSNYKRCSICDVSYDFPENHGTGTLVMASLGTFSIMMWKVSVVCLLSVCIIRLCDNGIRYLWTTTEGHVIMALAIFLVSSFFFYMLLSCCKTKRTVNRPPVFI